jgi:hypothetical protein
MRAIPRSSHRIRTSAWEIQEAVRGAAPVDCGTLAF